MHPIYPHFLKKVHWAVSIVPQKSARECIFIFISYKCYVITYLMQQSVLQTKAYAVNKYQKCREGQAANKFTRQCHAIMGCDTEGAGFR